MLDLHERRLESLDGVEDLVAQGVVFDLKEYLLDHVVAELIVNQFLNNEVHAGLCVFAVSHHLQLAQDLLVVLREGSLEDLLHQRGWAVGEARV